MEIVTQAPSLWTNVILDYQGDNARFQNNLSLLGVQLARAKEQLLDITWRYDPKSPHNVLGNQFIRQHAPFSRWRSLYIMVFGGEPLRPDTTLPEDTLVNLEQLKVGQYPLSSFLLSLLYLGETPKLRMLDLSEALRLRQDFRDTYKPIMGHVTHIKLPKAGYDALEFDAPPNITHIEAQNRILHNFPHIQSYVISDCRFASASTVDLRNLTSLTVNHLEVYSQIILPALRDARFLIINIHEGGKLEAPQLESLRILAGPTAGNSSQTKYVHSVLVHPGYSLWPTKSISIDVCLPRNDIITLLARCPDVEQVSLSFNDPLVAQQILAYIANSSSRFLLFLVPSSQGVCRRLERLMLHFEWTSFHFDDWKERASRLVGDSVPSLRYVYGVWRPNGVSMRLA